MWGPRAQIDRVLYKKAVQNELFNQANLEICASSVEDLIMAEPSSDDAQRPSKTLRTCKGVVLPDGTRIYSKTVVITTGTFLRGQINIGSTVRPAGRIGDEPAIGLALSLESLEFRLSRLKTGTPPRLRASSIDYKRLEVHHGDSPPVPFSFMNDQVWLKAEDQVRYFHFIICLYKFNCASLCSSFPAISPTPLMLSTKSSGTISIKTVT